MVPELRYGGLILFYKKQMPNCSLSPNSLGSMSPNLKSAVLNTSGTIICFRIGYQDAYQLAKEIFPSSEFSATKKNNLKVKHLGPFPYLTIEQDAETLNWDGLAQTLTKLPSREFWSKQRGHGTPAHHRTFNVPDPVFTNELKDRVGRLLDTSGRRYGRLKQDAQKGYARRYQNHNSHPNDPENNGSPDDSPIPFWGN